MFRGVRIRLFGSFVAVHAVDRHFSQLYSMYAHCSFKAAPTPHLSIIYLLTSYFKTIYLPTYTYTIDGQYRWTVILFTNRNIQFMPDEVIDASSLKQPKSWILVIDTT